MSDSIDKTPAWEKLKQHYRATKNVTLRELFANDEKRGTTMALEYDGVYLDYSKNLITDETLPLLRDLLNEAKLDEAREAMFNGEKINTPEDRAVLHVALRSPKEASIFVDGEDVVPEVHRILDKMEHFANQVRSGEWTGYSGKRIKNIVHIGIGGAEIGSHMTNVTLGDYQHPDLRSYFISNIDPASFLQTTRHIKPDETLFIVSSKSFTTAETLANAESAKQWLLANAPEESAVAKHFVAISTNAEAVAQFGIDPQNMFEMRDWVGGRFSMMGATGLNVMIMLGPEHFREILKGARSMDEHFRSAPPEKNMPVTLALISTWYNNFFGAETELFVPYSAKFDLFATYFQQGNMESNGKSVRLDGQTVTTSTGPIVWGRPGSDAQHTFMQHVHQGTHLIPADILLFKEPFEDVNDQYTMLLANALAQAEALAFGKTDEELQAEGIDAALIPHKRMPGNRPSNVLLFKKLTPYTFGQLIALYEHKIFVQGVIWGINSFDQWGVELAKVLASTITSELRGDPTENHDSSTKALIKRLRD